MELCVIAEEVGRAVAPIPFFSSICLAAEAIQLAGSAAQKEKWLPKLASGEAVGTLAWTEGAGAPRLSGLATRLAGGALTGMKSPVPDAAIAQVCVVVAAAGGRPALALVELDQPGVTLTPMTGFDQLRQGFETAQNASRNRRSQRGTRGGDLQLVAFIVPKFGIAGRRRGAVNGKAHASGNRTEGFLNRNPGLAR